MWYTESYYKGFLLYNHVQNWKKLQKIDCLSGKAWKVFEVSVNRRSHWEMTLQCNVTSHWLNPYQEWSLMFYVQNSRLRSVVVDHAAPTSPCCFVYSLHGGRLCCPSLTMLFCLPFEWWPMVVDHPYPTSPCLFTDCMLVVHLAPTSPCCFVYSLRVIGSPPCPSLSMLFCWQFAWCRADSRFAPSQWETSLLCNAVSLAGCKSRISPSDGNSTLPQAHRVVLFPVGVVVDHATPASPWLNSFKYTWMSASLRPSSIRSEWGTSCHTCPTYGKLGTHFHPRLLSSK